MHDRQVSTIYDRAQSIKNPRVAIIPATPALPPIDVIAVTDAYVPDQSDIFARLCDTLVDAYCGGIAQNPDDIAERLRDLADDIDGL